MLVLTRKVGERIYIGKDVSVVVVEVNAGRVRLGVEAPRDVPVHRQEIMDRIKAAEEVEIAPPLSPIKS